MPILDRQSSSGAEVAEELIGTFNSNRLCAAHLANNEPNADGERGALINTASIAAFGGQIGQVAYTAAKAGIAGTTLTMARNLGSLGIRVDTIAPNLFSTGLTAGATDDQAANFTNDAAFRHRLGRSNEYGCLATAMIESPMLNGDTIRLDAGRRFRTETERQPGEQRGTPVRSGDCAQQTAQQKYLAVMSIELPAGVTAGRRTPDFTKATCPAGLLAAHRAATWAQLEVAKGTVAFTDEVTGARSIGSPGAPVVIAPDKPHHIEPTDDAVFAVQFFDLPN